MDALKQKAFTTSRNLTYTYYSTPSTTNAQQQSTLLLLHGWPTNAHLWDQIVPSLLQLPYRIIVPDLLGYGETSKPTDPKLYSSKSMVTDLIELLDNEEVDKIIPIGHDFGSWLAQRVYLFEPARCVGLVLLSVAYMVLNTGPMARPSFSLDEFLEITEQMIGYPQYAYFEFFVAPDGAEVMSKHLESLWTLLHADQEGMIRDYYCEKGAFRKYLEEERRMPVKEYAKVPGMKSNFLGPLEKDGFDGPQCWYLAIVDNVHYEAEKELTLEDLKVNVPVLFVGCNDDAVARADTIEITKNMGVLPDLDIKVLDCAHYCPFEKPVEVAEAIVEFLKKKGL